MPIYAYRCPDCGHELEKLTRRDEPAPLCPECIRVRAGDHGAAVVVPSMVRTMSPASFALKGRGWSRDGYG